MIFVLFLALCIAICWYQWKFVRAYRHFPSKRLDTTWLLSVILGKVAKNVPLTSIALQKVIEVTNEFQAEGVCVVWLLRPYICIYGEELMKSLVNEVALADKGFAYDVNGLLIGNGLIGSKHEVWKDHHKFLKPSFNLGALKCKIPIFNEHANSLVLKLESVVDTPIDNLMIVLRQITFRIMAEGILGLQLKNKSHEILSEKFLKVIDIGTEQFVGRLFRPWLYWDFLLPLFPSGRKYLESVNICNRIQDEIMKELKAAVISNEEQQDAEEEVNKCPGKALIFHHLQDPNFTEQDVRDHLVSFTVAGFDAVSSTMTWCLYLLGHHPQVQEKAYNEVETIVAEGDVTFDDIFKMKYLECVMKESLRLYPSPIFARRASKEIQCGKYIIPKNAEVAFCPFMLHRNPNVHPQPETFDPERFSDGSKIRPWMYIPFAEGYRHCIGKRFAMMEMKVLLARVIRRFKVTTLNRLDNSDLDWTIILKSLKPPQVLFELRQPQT